MEKLSVSFSRWLAYVIAACLMGLGIAQTLQILKLKSQLQVVRAEVDQLARSNALQNLHVAMLEAKDASYAPARIVVAWDSYQHRGVIALENLPAPPAAHDYQLWVLDPGAETPISAGLISASGPFTVGPVSTQAPGFAISLEPTGGGPALDGPILFAVAPGE